MKNITIEITPAQLAELEIALNMRENDLTRFIKAGNLYYSLWTKRGDIAKADTAREKALRYEVMRNSVRALLAQIKKGA